LARQGQHGQGCTVTLRLPAAELRACEQAHRPGPWSAAPAGAARTCCA
jgi:hypothetical protein